jgi:hypothetical protein
LAWLPWQHFKWVMGGNMKLRNTPFLCWWHKALFKVFFVHILQGTLKKLEEFLKLWISVAMETDSK